MTRLLGWLMLSMCLAAGCAGSGAADLPPELRYGHRFEGAASDRIPTVEITTADSDVEYFSYPAYVDSVYVRPGRFQPNIPVEMQRLAVEVLVLGAFPDGCFELHDLRQRRYGHIMEVDLLMRKPQQAVCERIRRPFRYYFHLNGSFGTGHYTLKLNGEDYPFSIRADRI